MSLSRLPDQGGGDVQSASSDRRCLDQLLRGITVHLPMTSGDEPSHVDTRGDAMVLADYALATQLRRHNNKK